MTLVTAHDNMKWRWLILSMIVSAMVWTPTESREPPLSDVNIGCNVSCSAQVNCSIQKAPISFLENKHLKDDLNIPGEPFDLNLIQSNDSEYQYFNFTWNIPQDGSLHFLTGFLVNIKIFGTTGIAEEQSYLLNLPSNWSSNAQYISNTQGAMVFLHCFKVYKESHGTIEVRIYSLPINQDSPKRAKLTISLSKLRWRPKIKMMKDADTLHITLLNPLAEIKKYVFELSSATQGGTVIRKIEVKPDVNSSEIKDKALAEININFTIPDIYKKDMLTIIILTGDHVGNHLQTKPGYEYEFDFSENSIARIDDNRLIIIPVTVSLVFVATALVCVLCRVKIWHKVRRWIYSSSQHGSLSKNKMKLPKIFPIYCYENDTYVKAVQCHLSLLRHYVGHSALPSRDFVSQDRSWVDSQIQNCSILIYISPKFRELLQTDVNTSGLCPLDALCFLSLQSLQQFMLRDASSSLPCIVYLDCFEQETLMDIQDLLLSQSQTEVQLMPLKLASLNSNIWQLENLDQLFQQLFRVSKLSPQFSQSLYGWKERKEAKDFHKQLYLLTQAQLNTNNTEVHFIIDNCRDSPIPNGAAFIPCLNKNKLCSLDTVFMEDLIASDAQSLDDNVHPIREAVDGIETEMASRVPLISGSSGFHSGSYDQELNSVTHPATEYSTETSEGVSDIRATGCVKFLPNESSRNFSRPFLNYSVDDCHPILLQSLTYSKKPVDTIGSYLANGVKQAHERELSFLSPSADSVSQTDHYWNTSNGHAFCQNLKIIPPHLCLSSSTSSESLSERINRVNDSNLNHI